MLIKKVIINSSPLIVLFKSQQAQLLPQLFAEILVPEAVWNEIALASKNDEASQQLPQVNWVQKRGQITITPEIAGWDLGKGEAEVLSLTLNNPTYYLGSRSNLLAQVYSLLMIAINRAIAINRVIIKQSVYSE